MIPKFIQLGMNAFNKEEVDYIIIKDSDLPEEYEGFQFFVVMKDGTQHTVEFIDKYEIEDMQEFLSEFDMITVQDSISGDIQSVNVENIIYMERDIKGLFRIHFKKNILCLPINKDKDVYELVRRLVEWD